MATSNDDLLMKVAARATREAGKWERTLEANPTRKRIDEWEHYQYRAFHYKEVALAALTLKGLHYRHAAIVQLAAINSYDCLDQLVHYVKAEPQNRHIGNLSRLPASTLKLYSAQDIVDAFTQWVPLDDYAFERKYTRLLANAYRNIGSVPDFFPTPEEAAWEMLGYSMARNDENSINLEPSAGMGDLAVIMQREYPAAQLWLIERQYSLYELLEARGFHMAGDDFLEFTTPVDHIIMNPPFSGGNDAKHIKHAYSILKPGGSLVALAANSITFQTRGEYSGFAEWLKAVDGRMEKMTPGKFKGKGISIDPVIVYISEKREVVTPEPAPPKRRKAKQA